MCELHQDGLEFRHNGELVPPGMMPFTLIQQMTELELAEAEFDENILRADLSWQERAAAVTKLHELRQKQNPTQTQADTAFEIVLATQPAANAKDRKRVEVARQNLVQAMTVSKHLSDPRIANSKNVHAAYRQILDTQRVQFERELIAVSGFSSNHTCLQGDCREVMNKLTNASFDTLIVDPPYGIDADKMKTDTAHNYKDDKDYAVELCRYILRRGFHLLKPQGIGFMFCDIEHFLTLRTIAEQQAFSTWRKPIIWQKDKATGHAPWGRNGFTYTYECLLFFVKGQKALVDNGGPDVRYFERTARAEKLHAAEKPIELLSWLLQISSRPGDAILDPCCGSGSIFDAAATRQLSVTGIELDDTYHAMACSRLLKLGDADAKT
jgi:DNA modification methylase